MKEGTAFLLFLLVRGGFCLNWRYTFNGNDYYITNSYSDDDYSWYTAREACMKDGGDLATIETKAEDDWIKTTRPSFSSGLWMGLNKLSGKWTWVDGKSTSLDEWPSYYPKDDHLCAYRYNYYNNLWYSDNCAKHRGMICKRPSGFSTHTPKTTPPTTTVGGYCPSGYTGTNSDKCFKFVGPLKKSVKWDDAKKACQDENYKGANLACINSPADSALLTYLVGAYKTTDKFFLGLRKTSSSYPWTWVDNTPVGITNWADGTSTYTYGCAYISSGSKPSGSWYNDLYCNDYLYGYVCQISKDPANIIPTAPPTQPHSCPSGYTPHGKDCYRFIDQEMTWAKAKQYCDNQGTSMAYMHTNEEAAAVQFMLLMQDAKYQAAWTGLYYDDSAREYKWENDWYVLFTRWGQGQPKRAEGGGCVSMLREDGDWYDDSCSNSLPVICKKSTGDAITPPPVMEEGRCLNNQWFELGGHCYFMCYGTGCNAAWSTTLEECKRMHPNATMASIHDPATNDIIKNKLYKVSSYAVVWLGMYRSVQDHTWRWTDESPLEYSNFYPGYPNDDPSSNYDCTYMSVSSSYKGRWISSLCTYTRGRLCKMNKLPIEPSPPPVNGSCPGQGWVQYGSTCYLFKPRDYRTWTQARKSCTLNGGPDASLAVITTWEQNSYIHDGMTLNSDLPMSSNFWIGLSKKNTSAPYEWVDGTKTNYTYWGRTQPSADTLHYCVEVNYLTSQWHNEVCGEYIGYVCQAPVRVGGGTTPATEASNDLSGGEKAGIVIGILIGALILIALAFVIFKGMTGEPVNLYDRFA